MDFTGLTGYYHSYVEDPATGVITVTFEKKDRSAVIGTLSIEKTKFNAFALSLAEAAKEGHGAANSNIDLLPATLSFGSIIGATVPSSIVYSDKENIFENINVGDVFTIQSTVGYNGSYYIIEKLDNQRIRLDTEFNVTLVLDGKFSVKRIAWRRRSVFSKNEHTGSTEFFV